MRCQLELSSVEQRVRTEKRFVVGLNVALVCVPATIRLLAGAAVSAKSVAERRHLGAKQTPCWATSTGR